MVHIYCGEGKGKTTAAMGLAVRMAGSGGKVIIFQFLKDNSSSERLALEKIRGIDLMRGYENVKFTFRMSKEEKRDARIFYEEKLDEIRSLINNERYDMVILDEVIGAVDKRIVRTEKIIEFIEGSRPDTEIVMTGRGPCSELLARADYVTEMKKLNHPYDRGISARRGIEF